MREYRKVGVQRGPVHCEVGELAPLLCDRVLRIHSLEHRRYHLEEVPVDHEDQSGRGEQEDLEPVYPEVLPELGPPSQVYPMVRIAKILSKWRTKVSIIGSFSMRTRSFYRLDV